ncbi:cytochrome P450-dit2 [Entomortierella beljakovae]|nr:cytochrome P450-dit2 [Entomortierella beljakovae]
MAILALASSVRLFAEKHLSKSDRSPVEIAVIAGLGILIAAIAKYPDRALFVRARPDLKDKTIPGVPLLGNLPGTLLEKENQLVVIKRGFDHYGDVFSLTVPLRGRFIAINNPELIEHILKTNFSNYIKGEIFSGQLRDMLGNGIFVTDGEEWKHHRRSAVGIFTTKMYRQVTRGGFTKGASDLCSYLDKFDKNKEPVDLQATFLKQTLDVFGRLTFGIELNSIKSEGPHEFGDAFDFLMTNIDSRIQNPVWELTDHIIPGKTKKLKHAIGILDKYAYIAIEKRKNESSEDKENRQKDLLDHFIGHVREDGSKLSDLELRDAFVNFMLAGRDTTSYTLAWQFYSLLANPRILKNVLKELQVVLKGSQEYSYEIMVNELPYLKAVFHETLRLYPPVPRNIKEAVNDDVLPDGTIIHKDDKIIFSTWSMGRNRSVWGEDAEIFCPERWIADEDEASVRPTSATSSHGVSPFGRFKMENQFKFNSFNSSPRLCLGQTFATLQAMITTCMLLQTFDMKLVPNQPIPEPKPSAAIPMLNPLMVYVQRKKSHGSHKPTPLSVPAVQV